MKRFANIAVAVGDLAAYQEGNKAMISRILVGAAMVAVLAGILWIGGMMMPISFWLFICCGIYEMMNCFEKSGRQISRLSIIVFAITLLPLVLFNSIVGVMIALLIAMMIAFGERILTSNLDLDGLVHTAMILIYPGVFGGLLISLAAFPYVGRMGLIMTLGYACVPDVFAYFVGSAIGKHKMSPAVSPKKSWEGAGGAIVGGIVVGILISLAFGNQWIRLWHLLLLGVLGPILGMLGDLSASLIKRVTNISDYSKIFGEHGGMMDRLDSILFVAPLIFFYFYILV